MTPRPGIGGTARAACGLGAALCALLFAAACQTGGVPSAEFPDAPLAVLYRTPEESRLRAEALADAEQGNGPPPRSRPGVDRENRAIARADDVASFFDRVLGAPPNEGRDYAGRLALLDVRSGEVEPIRGARPGAIPHAWSPDRERLLFSQVTDAFPQLFEWNRISKEVRPITRPPGSHPDGCYGPDGRFVYTTAGLHEGRLYSRITITDPGGSNPRFLSEGPQDHSPACAPDGSAVAWVATLQRGDRLLVQRPVQGGRARILGPGRFPSFAPDSEWIVYSAPVKRQWKLWRIRADGSGRAPIGRGGRDELHPAVSPTGRLVVYVSEDSYRQQLFLRRFDGSGDRILFADGDAWNPIW